MGPSWAILGLSWAILSHLGDIWGPSSAILGHLPNLWPLAWPQHCWGISGPGKSPALLREIWAPKIKNKSPWEGMSFPPAAFETPPCDLQPSSFDLRTRKAQNKPEQNAQRTRQSETASAARPSTIHRHLAANARHQKGGRRCSPPGGFNKIKSRGKFDLLGLLQVVNCIVRSDVY